ncbi:cell division protein SepF [Actinoplanes sp. TFC3]|uniref:cell division protein SepF n=1 Tax=Actinoplanes sp. TFC3 TaxID=1710355 RepID=UPI001379FF1C
MNQNFTALGYVAVLISAATSLLIVCAALAFSFRGIRRPGRLNTAPGNRLPSATPWVTSELDQALDAAVALNPYNVGRKALQAIHLANAVRYSPNDYSTAAREVADSYRQNRIVSLDLSNMNSQSAVRLVDFCSGLLAAKSGWIFRPSDFVIILTPGVE